MGRLLTIIRGMVWLFDGMVRNEKMRRGDQGPNVCRGAAKRLEKLATVIVAF